MNASFGWDLSKVFLGFALGLVGAMLGNLWTMLVAEPMRERRQRHDLFLAWIEALPGGLFPLKVQSECISEFGKKGVLSSAIPSPIRWQFDPSFVQAARIALIPHPNAKRFVRTLSELLDAITEGNTALNQYMLGVQSLNEEESERAAALGIGASVGSSGRQVRAALLATSAREILRCVESILELQKSEAEELRRNGPGCGILRRCCGCSWN
jgi:hypothetical protein